MYLCMYVCNVMLCYVMLCYVMLCFVCMYVCIQYIYIHYMYIYIYIYENGVGMCRVRFFDPAIILQNRKTNEH